MWLTIIDSDRRIISSNVPQSYAATFTACESESEIIFVEGKKSRHGLVICEQGKIYGCSDEEKYTESSKLFKKDLYSKISLFDDLVILREEIKTAETAKTKRLLHNLITLNGHTLQELYFLVSQDELSKESFSNQVNFVEKKIKADPRIFSEGFLKVLKNEISLKNEFSVYKKINDPNPILDVRSHEIHRVLLNVSRLFFQVFIDKNAQIKIAPCNISLRVDYESFQVALYHIFDNASKYCSDNTVINITTSELGKHCFIKLYMVSLFVEPNEVDKLYEEGFSAEAARKSHKSGSGLGMGQIRQLLKLNRGNINFIAEDQKIELNGKNFGNNVVELVFEK